MMRAGRSLGWAGLALCLVGGCTSTGAVDEEDAGGGVGTRDAGFRRTDGGGGGATSSSGGGGSSTVTVSSGAGSSSRASSSVGGSSQAGSGGGSSVAGSSSRASSSSTAVVSSSRASSSVGGVSSSTAGVSSSVMGVSSSAAGQSSSAVVVSSSAGGVSSSAGQSSSTGGGSSGFVPTQYMWTHSPTILYRVNPADNFSLDAAWTFEFREQDGTVRTDQEMVDIAMNNAGEMYGVSWNPAMTGAGTNNLYRITVPTVVGMGLATATRVGTLSYYYNALSFVSAGQLRPAEVLIALDNETQYPQSFMDIINTSTARTDEVVGGLGQSLKSSGDVVAIDNVGIFATARDSNGTNFLVQLNNMGTATVLGNGLGETDVWGVAYWGGEVVAFTQAGKILRVDRTNGMATFVRQYSVELYGGAVPPNTP